MNITLELADEKVKEIVSTLLCSAFEGGSNYWYRIDGYVFPEGKTQKDLEAEKALHPNKFERTFYPHIDLPAMGGGVKVKDMYGDKGCVILTWAKCKKALQLMAQPGSKCGAHHWSDVISDNTDGITGDVFLQLALWGEVIYG